MPSIVKVQAHEPEQGPGSLLDFIRQHQIDGPPVDVEKLIEEGEAAMADEFMQRLARTANLEQEEET